MLPWCLGGKVLVLCGLAGVVWMAWPGRARGLVWPWACTWPPHAGRARWAWLAVRTGRARCMACARWPRARWAGPVRAGRARAAWPGCAGRARALGRPVRAGRARAGLACARAGRARAGPVRAGRARAGRACAWCAAAGPAHGLRAVHAAGLFTSLVGRLGRAMVRTVACLWAAAGSSSLVNGRVMASTLESFVACQGKVAGF